MLGRSPPLPGVMTLDARPEAVLAASAGGAFTSAGAGMGWGCGGWAGWADSETVSRRTSGARSRIMPAILSASVDVLRLADGPAPADGRWLDPDAPVGFPHPRIFARRTTWLSSGNGWRGPTGT